MTIINYQEFTEAFNDLFANNSIRDIQNFGSAILKSKEKRKQTICQISKEINKLKIDIEKYQYRIRLCASKKDKKECGIILNSLLTSKKDLIKQYNQQRQANAFTELSYQAKIYACAMALLNKYMTDEICRHNPLGFARDADGHIIVQVDYFKNSHLYQSAAHIKDFTSSYIENYPERVKGARYFIGLYKNIKSFNALIDEIDRYFENMNQPEQKEQQRIKKSHEGLIPIAVFADDYVQAVKLISKNALDYEGSALKHCVGTYASKVENGETEIYSIRDIGAENKELMPHATIEFKDGAIQQIKGYRDGLVDFDYIRPTRLLAMRLLHTDNFDDVVNDKNLRLQDKNNIGIYQDVRGNIHDIFNLSENDVVFDNIIVGGSALSYFPIHKMNISSLTVKGVFPQKNLLCLDERSKFKCLNLSDCVYDGTVLDLSNACTHNLRLNFKQAPNLTRIIFPEKASEVSLSGNLPNLTNIEMPNDLHYLEINGTMPQIKTFDFSTVELIKLNIKISGESELAKINLPENLQEFGISGNLPYLTDINIPQNLRVFDFGVVVEEGLQRRIMQQIDQTDKLSLLKLSWEKYPVETISIPLNVAYLDISCDNFPNLRMFDLSANKKLKTLEFSNPNMPQLSVFKLPENLENLVCCSFSAPNLKELDLSKLPIKHFGRLNPQTIGNIVFGYDTDYLQSNSLENRSLIAPSAHLGGFTFQCADFSGLEKFYLPLEAETINLSGMHLENLGYVDFFEYKKLQKVNMEPCYLGKNCVFDFSKCPSLKSLNCSDKAINQIKVPPQIERIVVCDKNYHAQVHNYQTFTKKQKALWGGFFPKPIYHEII